ncbi:MAG: cobalamin-dependent protein [Nitrososphaerales archaeon]
MEKVDLKKILSLLLDFKGEKIKGYCLERLQEGADAYEIFNELSLGLEEIGKGYENEKEKRYFTSDLIVSGRNMKRAIEILKPHIKSKKSVNEKGVVLLGTVKGDVHDIGKMIVGITLEANGFRVIDLGVDVDKERFVKKVDEINPDILGLSALLTSTAPYMKEVIEALKSHNLRDKVKVIVGGRAVTENLALKWGADAYAQDSIDGLKKCLALIGERV